MKTTILILLVLFLGCEEPNHEAPKAIDYGNQHDPNLYVETYDSCEYMVYKYTQIGAAANDVAVSICHKGNCIYCEQRRKKP